MARLKSGTKQLYAHNDINFAFDNWLVENEIQIIQLRMESS
jgi:hypothetical protein